jgi:hypothetical protein
MVVGESEAVRVLEKELYRSALLLIRHVIFVFGIVFTDAFRAGMEDGTIAIGTRHLRRRCVFGFQIPQRVTFAEQFDFRFVR